jgi:cobalt-zinc-cadmium efflux system outer membrane protein
MPTPAQVCAWIAGVALAVPISALAQDRTERDVVELIVRDGPQARAIRAGAEVVRREQLARLAYPNPSVMYSREGAGVTEFLQVEQSLPIFGTRAALSRAGVAATTAAEAEREARLWLLRADATAAVARLSAEQIRLDAAQAHVRDVERLIEILRTREREGEGSRFDRLRAEEELREARLVGTTAGIEIAAARAVLSAMLPPDAAVGRIATGDRGQSAAVATDALMTRAVSTRAELRALQLSGQRAAFESDAARRSRLPAPTVFGGLKRADVDGGRERGGIFGVNLSLPLFDSGRRDVARWTAEAARIDAERASLERQIRGEIVRASEALALRQAAQVADRDAAGTELMQIAEVAYREGEVGILELLDAVRTAARARMRSIELRLEVRLAQIAVERAVGDVLWP